MTTLAILGLALNTANITGQAKQKMVAAITKIRVTKHEVSGQTTKQATIKMFNANQKLVTKTKTTRKGTFKLKTRKSYQNLAFTIKATKAGYRTRTFKHAKIAKKMTQSVTKEQPITKSTTANQPTSTSNNTDTTTPIVSAETAKQQALATKIAGYQAELSEYQSELETILNSSDYAKFIELTNECDQTVQEIQKYTSQLVAAQFAAAQTNSTEFKSLATELEQKLNASRTKLEQLNKQIPFPSIQRQIEAIQTRIGTLKTLISALS